MQRPGWTAWEATEDGGTGDPVRSGPDPLSALVWGGYPDVLAVSCDQAPTEGGQYYAVDGYRLLDSLSSASPASGEGTLLGRLWSLPVPRRRHTRYDYLPWEAAPIARRTPTGKLSVLYAPRALVGDDADQPQPGSRPADAMRMLVREWHGLVESAARAAPRFALEPGDVLLIDNYRAYAGRDHYLGPRIAHRVSLWTPDAHEYPLNGVRGAPDELGPDEKPPPGQPLAVTGRAARRLAPLLTTPADGATGIRVTVETRGCAGLWYRLTLREEGAPDDVALESRGIRVLTDPESAGYLQGAVIDWTDSGFTVRNGQIKATCACGASFSYRDDHVAELARRQPEKEWALRRS